jgi:hypothetical protein
MLGDGDLQEGTTMSLRIRNIISAQTQMAATALTGLALACVCLLMLASSALAANYTWSGSSTTSHDWSEAANWGGAAPSGAVGTLEFPELTTAACTANPATAACYETANDIGGVSANGISLDGPYKVNFSSFVSAPGDALTLGSDGLTTSDPGNLKAVYATAVNVPITLSAPQTWSINGSLYLGGGVGGNEALGVNLSGGGNVDLNGAVNTGPVRVTGANAADTGESADDNGAVWVGAADPAANITADFNGIDENPVRVNDAAIGSNEGIVGPLTLKGGDITFGLLGAGATLTVNGNLTLDAASALESDIIYVPNSVSTATRVIVSGPVNLGGAHLKISKFGFGECELPEGDVFTLVTTTGSLEGTFGGLPNGSVVTMEKCPAPRSALRINYTSHSVTATVIGPAFTWSGEGPPAESTWSNGANWGGVSAPSGKVGTLTFPALTSAACTADPATDTCYESMNNLAGLEANALSISGGYSITGSAFSLGSGGITANAAASPPFLGAIYTPITLTAPQSWSIDGGEYAGLIVGNTVTGPSDALAIGLGHGSLEVIDDVEAGTVTVTGAYRLTLWGPGSETAKLNATDDNPVNFSAGTELVADNGATGPLTLTGAGLYLSNLGIVNSAGGLSVSGGVTLGNKFTTEIVKSGTVAEADYGQLTATGPINLDSAQLTLFTIASTGMGFRCLALKPGEVYTLATTAGALSGTFDGVPDGATVSGNCGLGAGTPPTARIHYTANAVTATIETSGSGNGAGEEVPASISPPTISGIAEQAQTLTEQHGSWTNSPNGYSYQWQRCEGAGNNCQAIEGATAQTYTLTSTDVGSTIRVQETASNTGGSSSPATSAATAVIQSPLPGGGESSGGGGSGEGAAARTATTAPVSTMPSGSSLVSIVGQSQTVSVISGTVLVRLKGTTKFVPLSSTSTIPDGSEVEATNGHILITVATPNGHTETAEVWGGRFLIHQEHAGSGETHFILSLPLTGCPRVALPRGSAATLAAGAKHSSGPKSRHLWVSEGGGSWGTNGRYVSTTVEGTHWLTLDECNRSEVQVVAGKVQVHDLIHNKTKVLTAGKSYTAARRPSR